MKREEEIGDLAIAQKISIALAIDSFNPLELGAIALSAIRIFLYRRYCWVYN